MKAKAASKDLTIMLKDENRQAKTAWSFPGNRLEDAVTLTDVSLAVDVNSSGSLSDNRPEIMDAQ